MATAPPTIALLAPTTSAKSVQQLLPVSAILAMETTEMELPVPASLATTVSSTSPTLPLGIAFRVLLSARSATQPLTARFARESAQE